jgi:hypothetical protein
MGEGLKRARAAARATRDPVVLSREDYVVDGGSLQHRSGHKRPYMNEERVQERIK